MADLSRKTASIYINHQPAEDALKALQKQADTLQTKIKAGADAGKTMVSEISKLGKVQDDIAKVQKQIDSGLRPSFNQLQTTVIKTRNELKKMSEDAPGYADKFKAYQKASLELQRLGDSVNKVNAAQSKIGEFFSGFGGALAVGGIAAAGAALVGFFSDAIGEAAAAEEASARLHTTLENLGKADAFDRITKQSDDLAKSLGYLDNDDINGVFEKLLTYGKLTEAQMSKLAPVILDFSAKTRTSLPEATDTLLKALEGNGKALKTFGINIKDAGTEEERFGIVTGELAGKVAGAAEAFKGTFAGSVATTKQSIADLKEEIGTGLLPVFEFGLQAINGFIKGVEDLGRGVASVFDQIIHLRSGADQIKKEAAEAEIDSVNKFSSSLAADFIQKPLAKQKELLEGYTSGYLEAKAKYEEAIQEGSKETDKQREYLRLNVVQFKSDVDQLTVAFKNSQAEEDKKAADAKLKADQEAADKAEKQRDENAKKALAAAQRAKEKAAQARKQLENELAQLNKTIAAETDKIFLTDQQLAIKNVEQEIQKLQEVLKKGHEAGIVLDQEFADKSLDIERLRIRKIAALNLPQLAGQTATRATGAGIGGAGGPAAGAIASAANNGPGQLGDVPDEGDNPFGHILAQAQVVVDVAQSTFDIVESFNAAADARDQARIDKRVKDGENEKARNKRLLDGKFIDQQEFERRNRAADEKTRKETAKLKKQIFERDKKAQIVSATIMGAQAILSALTLQPFYLGLIMAGIAAVKTVAEINKIKQTKAPEFARGGVLDGPGHSQGGMPVTDPRSGRKVAELEGGEPILSRRTYANNRAIVDRLLYSSMYNNGAPIQPAWQTSPYFGMNYGALNRSVNHVKRYERGGVFGGENASDSGISSDAILQTLNTISNNTAKQQKAYVVLSEINAGNETLNDIKSDTVMSRK